MKDYTDAAPVFSDKIQIPETSDKAHADIINAPTKQLFANTLVLRNQAGIPNSYDAEASYNPGDMATYEGAIYKCNTKIEEGGEEWNPEHWEAISTIGEIEKSLEQTTRIESNVDLLVRNLVPLDKPVYGMIIHEQTDLDPESRVEYIGANKDYKPMKMNMDTHVMDQGDWADWDWLKGVVPVMCDWDGGIDYYLNPDDYSKKLDGTESGVSDINYNGNAMVVFPKIYTWEYKRGTDRVVLFCERKVSDDFLPVGFDVGGIERDYMLGPMFYGSIDDQGRMRSIAGQWSCLTASGAQTDLDTKAAFVTALEITAGVTTEIQYKAIQKTSKSGLFFGGPLTNTLADICVMISRSTNSQTAFGAGMNNTYENDKSKHYGTQANAIVDGGMFYGSSDNKSFNKIFHSIVLGSYMLWQRDPYMVMVSGRIKVSTDYTYDPTGAKYLDTGIDFRPGDTSPHYYPSYHVVKEYGPVPDVSGKDKGSSSTGYCDATWANADGERVSFRFGGCGNGLHDGLWARTLLDVAALAWWYYAASLLLPAPAAA